MRSTGILTGALLTAGFALLVAPTAAAAEPIKLDVLRGLSQTADVIVSATIERVRLPQPASDGEQTTRAAERPPARVVAKVSDVYLGPLKLAEAPLTFTIAAAESPIKYRTETPRLLFLRETPDGYALAFWERFGVFALEDGFVRAWWEGQAEGENLSLREVLLRVEAFRDGRIEIRATVERFHERGDDKLRVSFVYQNRGDEPITVLPPSYYRHAVRVTRLIEGRMRPEVSPNISVGNWTFIDGTEPPIELAPGGRATFDYPIPRTLVGADDRGVYKIVVHLRGYQLTPTGNDKIANLDHNRLWLGNFGPRELRTSLR